MTMIVYALVDPRTSKIRYIGKSTRGMIRPLDHKYYTHSGEIAAWLRDLKACNTTYVVTVLAEALTEEQLAKFEAYWISAGQSFGWPLANKQGISGSSKLPPSPLDPSKRWSAKEWRRDPEVRARLAAAKASRKSKTG